MQYREGTGEEMLEAHKGKCGVGKDQSFTEEREPFS